MGGSKKHARKHQLTKEKEKEKEEEALPSLLKKYSYHGDAVSNAEAEVESRELSFGQKLLKEQEKSVSHQIAANRRIADIRMVRLVEFLHQVANNVNEDAPVYPYLCDEVHVSAYSLVLACCLALGDERTTARLFVEPHNLRFGDTLFDPLRERLRPVPGIFNARLGEKGLCILRSFLEGLRQAPSKILFPDSFPQKLLEEPAARGLASLAGAQCGSNLGARLIKEVQNAQLVIQAATSLGFRAVLGSRFSIEQDTGNRIIWRLRAAKDDYAPAAASNDVLIADFDLTKGMSLPILVLPTGNLAHNWDQAQSLSVQHQTNTKANKTNRWRREEFIACVESAELAATASERILHLRLNTTTRLDHLYAVSASLDIAAELKPTQRLRDTETDHAAILTPSAVQVALSPLLELGVPSFDTQNLITFAQDYCYIVQEAFYFYSEDKEHFLMNQLPETSSSTEALVRLYTPGTSGLKSGARLKHRLQTQLDSRRAQSQIVALRNHPPLSFYILAACLLFVSHLSLSVVIFVFSEPSALLKEFQPIAKLATHQDFNNLLHQDEFAAHWRRLNRRKRRLEIKREYSMRRMRWLYLQCGSALSSVIVIIFTFRRIVSTGQNEPFTLATAYATLRKKFGNPLFEPNKAQTLRNKCLATLTQWQCELSARIIQASLARGSVCYDEAYAALQGHSKIPYDEPYRYLNLPEAKDPPPPERAQHLAVYPMSTALLDSLEHLLAPAHRRRSFVAAAKIVDRDKKKTQTTHHKTHFNIRQALEKRANWSFVEQQDGTVQIVRPSVQKPTRQPVQSHENTTPSSTTTILTGTSARIPASGKGSHRVIPKAQPGDNNPAHKPTPPIPATSCEESIDDPRQRDVENFETPVDIIGNLPKTTGAPTHRRTRRRRPD